MKKALTTLAAVLAITGCASMTERQKHWAGIAAGVLVVGAIAAHRGGDSATTPTSAAGTVGPGPSCHPQPDGSCR